MAREIISKKTITFYEGEEALLGIIMKTAESEKRNFSSFVKKTLVDSVANRKKETIEDNLILADLNKAKERSKSHLDVLGKQLADAIIEGESGKMLELNDKLNEELECYRAIEHEIEENEKIFGLR